MGLLINGVLRKVPGLTIIPPASHGGPSWAQLGIDDYKPRSTTWVRQVLVHTTKGIYPQHEIPGTGPGGAAKTVADFWADPAHSAAQIVVDTDGSIVCLCDLGTMSALHAEASNPWSNGIEMYQLSDGGIYQATLEATVRLIIALTLSGAPVSGLFPIPAQLPRLPYRNRPLARMETGTGSTRKQLGGPDLCGVFGHRDNTERRGQGDPGDLIYHRLGAMGFEQLNFDAGEDIAVGKARQAALNAHDDATGYTGKRLVVDGVCGPASVAAMQRQGFGRWRDVV